VLITAPPVCRWARAVRARGWDWDPTLQPGLRPGASGRPQPFKRGPLRVSP